MKTAGSWKGAWGQAALVVGLILGLAGPSAEAGILVVDQLQPQYAGTGEYTGVNENQHMAQTFTPADSGALSQIELLLASQSGFDANYEPIQPGNLVVEIRTTVQNTAFVFGGTCGQRTTWIPSSTILASTVVPAPAIQQDEFRSYVITFSTPAHLDAGRRYAIVLRMLPPSTQGGMEDPFDWWGVDPLYKWGIYRGLDATDPYAQGEKMVNSSGVEGLWSITGESSNCATLHEETVFKTFMSL